MVFTFWTMKEQWQSSYHMASCFVVKSTSSLFLHFFKTKIHTGIPVEKNSLAGKPITVRLDDRHIDKIVDTYQNRVEEARYSRRVELSEIETIVPSLSKK
jgi:methyl coenzyme M reductase subunit C-like uncharacterized protein (methanogenesis marker protein 7)